MKLSVYFDWISEEELQSLVIISLFVACLAAPTMLIFFAVSHSSIYYFYAALVFCFVVMAVFYFTLRHVYTLIPLLAFMAIVPSALYLWRALQISAPEVL